MVGLVLAAEALGTLLGDVPAGILFGRLGMRQAMLADLATLAVAVGCDGLLGGARGNSSSSVLSAAWAWRSGTSRAAPILTDATPAYKRGTAIAVFGGINRIGTFLGLAVGIAATFATCAPFWLYAGLAGAALIFPALFAGRHLAAVGPSRRHAGHTLHLWRRAPRQLSHAHARRRGAASGADGPGCAQDRRAALRRRHPRAERGDRLDRRLSSLVDMSLFPVAGTIMDRVGRKYAVPCFLIQGIAMALIPFTTGYYTFLLRHHAHRLWQRPGVRNTMMTLETDLAPRAPWASSWASGVSSVMRAEPARPSPWAAWPIVGLAPATFLMGGVGIAARRGSSCSSCRKLPVPKRCPMRLHDAGRR
ncbi:MAG: hypothetical protein R3A10_23210 [Caldilineaceae bacterium]